MAQYPDLVQNYAEYARINASYLETGKVDLADVRFIYPTTLLPLSGLIADNPSCYVGPIRSAPRGYISTILRPSSRGPGKSYVSLAELPHDKEGSSAVLSDIFSMCGDMGSQPGDISALEYAVYELVDNIYEHSKFTRALVLGQRYGYKGFADLSFYDDGVTIPGSLKGKAEGSPTDLVCDALGGKSAKDESRGFGLRTTFELFTNGLGSDFFVASGAGAAYGGKEASAYGGKDGVLAYELPGAARIDGTLITVRIPLVLPAVDIYDYVE